MTKMTTGPASPGRPVKAHLPDSGRRKAPNKEEWAMDMVFEEKSRLANVSWGLGFLGLMGYTFAIVTYRLPIGEPSMILGLIGVMIQPRRLKIPMFLVLFGVFLAWAFLWSGTSNAPGLTNESLMTGAKLWAVSFVAVNVIRTPAQFRAFIVFFIACFAMYPARGAIFNYFGGYTVVGRAIWNYSFENPNDLAALCFLPMSIAWALVSTERKGLFRWGALASIIVFPLLILLTQSRGAFLALVVVGGVGFLQQRRKARAIFLIGAMGAVALMVIPSSAWERFEGVASLTSLETVAEADEEGSAEARLNIWRTAWKIIKDHPVSGIGLGAYGPTYSRYAHLVPGAPDGMKDAHSTYILVAAETGFPGVIIFLGVLMSIFVKSIKTRRKVEGFAPRQEAQLRYLELGLAGYLLAGLFGSFPLLGFLYLHMALMQVAAEVVESQWRAEKRRAFSARQRVRPKVNPFALHPVT